MYCTQKVRVKSDFLGAGIYMPFFIKSCIFLCIPGSNTAGISVDFFADKVIEGLTDGKEEITYGFSTLTAKANQEEREEIFNQLNEG